MLRSQLTTRFVSIQISTSAATTGKNVK